MFFAHPKKSKDVKIQQQKNSERKGGHTMILYGFESALR